MKALKWQLMQSNLSENFGKWQPYLELFWGPQGAEILLGGAAALPAPHGTAAADEQTKYWNIVTKLQASLQT